MTTTVSTTGPYDLGLLQDLCLLTLLAFFNLRRAGFLAKYVPLVIPVLIVYLLRLIFMQMLRFLGLAHFD